MNLTGMLYGSKLLKYVGFPAAEVLGPHAGEEEIQKLIKRHGSVFIKPLFKGGIGKKGKSGLIGRASDLKTALKEIERLYYAEHRTGQISAKANGVTIEGAVPAEHEVYFAITDSTIYRAPTMTLTHRGGVDIEELDKAEIAEVPFDALTGIKSFLIANALSKIGASKEIVSPLVQQLPKLWELFHHYGMTTLELNPICMMPGKGGRLIPVACDFKCGFDRDDHRWQRLDLPAQLFAADFSDFEVEINQLRTYQGQSDVYVINDQGSVNSAREAVDALIELFARSGLSEARDENFNLNSISVTDEIRQRFIGKETDQQAEAMMQAVIKRGAKSVFLKFLESLGAPLTANAVLAGIATTIAWGPLMRKRISKNTARNLPWYLKIYAAIIGASVEGSKHEADCFCGVNNQSLLREWTVGEIAYLSLMGEPADAQQLFDFQILVGLLTTNGPGSISAQGCKGAVSSDGPQTPKRVQINKAMIGFLSHTGFSHGGAGYEGITFLVDQFKDTGLIDAGSSKHGLDLEELAKAYAQKYKKANKAAKEAGGERIGAIAGINHPVFKNKPVNKDPREVFIDELFKSRDEYNIFHEFYKKLVRELFEAGVTRNVFCVNIDGVISALLLKALWPSYRAGKLDERALEAAAFTIFLYGRMVGCAAEIEDHINRGRNMDTRTPASQLQYVS